MFQYACMCYRNNLHASDRFKISAKVNWAFRFLKNMFLFILPLPCFLHLCQLGERLGNDNKPLDKLLVIVCQSHESSNFIHIYGMWNTSDNIHFCLLNPWPSKIDHMAWILNMVIENFPFLGCNFILWVLNH